MTSVAVVVVRWRSGEELHRCLHSVLDHGGRHVSEVVVVDSGSGDGGAERVAAEFPDVRVLALEENRSFAWAANHGVEGSTASHLLVLNPDTEIRPAAVDALVEFVEGRETFAGAVPWLEHPDGSSQHRWQLRRLPTPWRLAMARPGRPAFPHGPPLEPAPVPQPAAAAWLVRRPVWAALGGLDPAFAPAWWEDVDWCARLEERTGQPGFPAAEGFWLVPEARVVHHGGASLEHLSDAGFLAVYHRNLLRYARRHHPRSARMIGLGVRMSLYIRAVVRPSRAAAYRRALMTLGSGRR
jgi:GT2 family glycosyltransferase